MSSIEKVETFIQRLHDMDYVIAPEASDIIYTIKSKPEEDRSLADYIANAISRYEKDKDSMEEIKVISARICLIWINRAFACGVVKEGQGLARKLKECRERNAELERDNERLSVIYLGLQREYEEFARRFKLPEELER